MLLFISPHGSMDDSLSNEFNKENKSKRATSRAALSMPQTNEKAAIDRLIPTKLIQHVSLRRFDAVDTLPSPELPGLDVATRERRAVRQVLGQITFFQFVFPLIASFVPGGMEVMGRKAMLSIKQIGAPKSPLSPFMEEKCSDTINIVRILFISANECVVPYVKEGQ